MKSQPTIYLIEYDTKEQKAITWCYRFTPKTTWRFRTKSRGGEKVRVRTQHNLDYKWGVECAVNAHAPNRYFRQVDKVEFNALRAS